MRIAVFIVALFSVCVTQAQISLVSPSCGSVWYTETTNSISFTNEYPPGIDVIKIDLIKGNNQTVISTICDNVISCKNSLFYKAPYSLPSGNDYALQFTTSAIITSCNFSIIHSVSEPNSNTEWSYYQKWNMVWDSSRFNTTRVKVRLVDYRNKNASSTESPAYLTFIVSNTGSYSYYLDVPLPATDIVPVNQYRLVVSTYVSDFVLPTYTDASDLFTIGYAANSPGYIGCYEYSQPAISDEKAVLSIDAMRAFCYSKNNRFVLISGEYYECSDSAADSYLLFKPVSLDRCNTPCVWSHSESCGGNSTVSVWDSNVGTNMMIMRMPFRDNIYSQSNQSDPIRVVWDIITYDDTPYPDGTHRLELFRENNSTTPVYVIDPVKNLVRSTQYYFGVTTTIFLPNETTTTEEDAIVLTAGKYFMKVTHLPELNTATSETFYIVERINISSPTLNDAWKKNDTVVIRWKSSLDLPIDITYKYRSCSRGPRGGSYCHTATGTIATNVVGSSYQWTITTDKSFSIVISYSGNPNIHSTAPTMSQAGDDEDETIPEENDSSAVPIIFSSMLLLFLGSLLFL